MSPHATSPAASALEFYRKQARTLLKAARAADTETLARIRIHLPHLTSGRRLLLSDTQWVIAREQGFASWPKFKHHLEHLTAPLPVASPAAGSGATAPSAEQSIQQIKTASWVTSHTLWKPQNEDPDGVTPYVGREWVRLDPPAHAWRHEDIDSWSHDVCDVNGHLHTASSWKMCRFDPRPDPLLAKSLLRKILFPPPPIEDNVEEAAAAKQRLDNWRQEPVELEGRSLLRWRRATIKANYRVIETIWTEPETHRIVRKEREETDLLTGKPASREVCEDYLYNIEIPEETFRMPPGKRIVTRDADSAMPQEWDALSPQQRQAIQETLNCSDAGWKNADFAAFATAWKFDYVDYVPDRSEWQARVEQQAGLWRQWSSEVESATTWKSLMVQVAAHSFTWRGKHKVLQVKVRLRVTWGEDGLWEGVANFFLRNKFGHYRIVHWECPWEEIKAARAGTVTQQLD